MDRLAKIYIVVVAIVVFTLFYIIHVRDTCDGFLYLICIICTPIALIFSYWLFSTNNVRDALIALIFGISDILLLCLLTREN